VRQQRRQFVLSFAALGLGGVEALPQVAKRFGLLLDQALTFRSNWRRERVSGDGSGSSQPGVTDRSM